MPIFTRRVQHRPNEWETPVGGATQTMRLFIFVVGQLRSAEACLDALLVNFTDFTGCQICVQCPVGSGALSRDIYHSEKVDEWDPPAGLPLGVRFAWPVFGDSGRGARRSKPSFWYQLARQARSADVFSNEIDVERDWILKWRPDLRLLGKFAWGDYIHGNAVWLPFHDNHSGFNDQCALGPARLMLKYLNRQRELPQYLGQGGALHAETFLAWALRDTPVQRMRIPYCIDRGERLNPVKICTSLGDVPDSALIEHFKTAGVQLETESPGTRAGQLDVIGRAWQRLVAQPLVKVERLCGSAW